MWNIFYDVRPPSKGRKKCHFFIFLIFLNLLRESNFQVVFTEFRESTTENCLEWYAKIKVKFADVLHDILID